MTAPWTGSDFEPTPLDDLVVAVETGELQPEVAALTALRCAAHPESGAAAIDHYHAAALTFGLLSIGQQIAGAA